MDRVSIRKARNRVKAKRRRLQSPVSKDQSTSPIVDAIRSAQQRQVLPFAIPAHAGGRVEPEIGVLIGHQAVRADLGMSHGVDRRDRSWEVQKTAQTLFADAVGAEQVFFSTNGSSLSVHVALLATVGDGRKIVVARNGHKSSFAGLIMAGAHPVYVDPVYDEELELAHSVDADEFARVLREHPNAAAGLIFTPSYYGTTADVAAVADACHSMGIPLITDDAWGLDYSFTDSDDYPPSALSQGADLAIGSVHKTLAGLAQTSVLSVGSFERLDPDRLQLCFELEESTSASALLSASIDAARMQFVRDGKELLAHAAELAHLARRRLAQEVPELRVIESDELVDRDGVADADDTHLLIETASIDLTGYAADDYLFDHHDLAFELADHRRVMAIVTFAHTEDDIDRLVRGLRDLVDTKSGAGAEVPRLPSRAELRTETVMRPRDAFFAETEQAKPGDAAGRVTAEMITPYPPGIPVLAPGELITEPIVDYLQEIVSLGGFVEGASDPSLSEFRVVRG